MNILNFIKNDRLRAIAKDSQKSHIGDFGMRVYGGIDMTLFTKNLFEYCDNNYFKDLPDDVRSKLNKNLESLYEE